MTDATSTLSPAAFRDVMGLVISPVAVVTTMDGTVPHGTTVGSFASLSLTPPMVVVCLSENSQLLTLVERSRRLGINVLSQEHVALAERFARKGGAAKFAAVDWTVDGGLPRLAQAPCWLRCDVETLVPGGDHTLVIATVHTADTAESPAPLAYYRRTFGTYAALSPPATARS